MKPRNKFEKAVLEQSKYLCPITKIQTKWAFRECIDHFAYRLPKGRTTCMDCGHSWIMNKHIPSLTPIIVESCYYYTFSVLAMDSVSYKFLFF